MSVAAFLASICLLEASEASAATPMTTRYPVGLPVSFGLPPGFASLPLQSGLKFIAASSARDATVTLGVGPFRGSSFEALAASAKKTSRQTLLSLDPNAAIRFQAVALPAGKAEETISQLTVTTSGRKSALTLLSYEFAYRGRTFTFTYYCPDTKSATYLAIFERSAHTIQFKS